ncbi:hypothetical protein LCGC14_2997450, partial [marine sediment metagenome]
DSKRRLSAMRDSSAGPIGMVAVMFSLGLKYLAFEEVASLGYFDDIQATEHVWSMVRNRGQVEEIIAGIEAEADRTESRLTPVAGLEFRIPIYDTGKITRRRGELAASGGRGKGDQARIA